MKRIAIVNNLWRDVTDRFFAVISGRPGVVIEDLLTEHNTAVPLRYSTYLIEAGRQPALARFRLRNNLLGFGAFGVPLAKADWLMKRMAPDAVIAGNALIDLGDSGDGKGATRNQPYLITQTMYRSFPSAAAAGINEDGTLTATSPNRRAGTDGTDIGVDFDKLRRAMTGPGPGN